MLKLLDKGGLAYSRIPDSDYFYKALLVIAPAFIHFESIYQTKILYINILHIIFYNTIIAIHKAYA